MEAILNAFYAGLLLQVKLGGGSAAQLATSQPDYEGLGILLEAGQEGWLCVPWKSATSCFGKLLEQVECKHGVMSELFCRNLDRTMEMCLDFETAWDLMKRNCTRIRSVEPTRLALVAADVELGRHFTAGRMPTASLGAIP